jgi:1-aminocyclopropane-1-carboxylate deaminase/D-cysteine desulfhydrase-like pyridoxal-dependent ACC family enzyme
MSKHTLEVPESFVCAGCKEEFTMVDSLIPNHIGNITQLDIELMCQGNHPQYGLLCDDCMALYLQVTANETVH